MSGHAMSIAEALRRTILTALIVGLATVSPAFARGHAAAAPATVSRQGTQVSIEEDNAQDQQDREQQARDREQEARDREQEARDREQEKKDREQERLDRIQQRYEEGRDALDEGKYARAEERFNDVIQEKGSLVDGAMYWKAYAENQQGKREAALSTIAELKKSFPQSKWRKDAEALEIEVRNSSGHPVKPDDVASDDDLFSLAFQGLMNSNPTQGIQKAEEILNGPASPKRKSKVLFVVAQNGSKEAQALLARIAQGQSNPDLQRKAVQYLGMFGGSQSASALASIYSSSADPSLKRAIIRSDMISGNREGLLKIAQSEKDEAIKREAIRNLGLTGGLS